MKQLRVRDEDIERERRAVCEAMREGGLVRAAIEIDRGRWGFTHIGLDLLDTLEKALAAGLEACKQLENIIRGGAEEPFAPPRPLAPEEQLFIGLFGARIAAAEAELTTAGLLTAPVRVENTFDLDAIRDLVDGPIETLPGRLVRDLVGYVRFHRTTADAATRVDSAESLARCVHAWCALLGNSVAALVDDTAFSSLTESMKTLDISVLGRRYDAFEPGQDEVEDPPSGLMPIQVDDIVGNGDYLEACLRTARDVAGFDLTTGRNPKTINPVLFALGRPGCGKTVTAHAVGNYFLDFCRERAIEARFLTIRRTDWASSYQNASANALVRIFRREVGEWPGVVCVYWADIDTAFAARSDPGIRGEERNVLGAAFGIFDGTLLEPNGKWFMMCDANYMNMDEATVSRITQEPFVLEGATTPAEIVRLLRDVKLRDHRTFLDLSEEEWLDLGARCCELDLSGRSLTNMARRVIAAVQDFEYPDEYYRADFGRRREIIVASSAHLDAADLHAIVDAYGAFEKEAEERASTERFERRVGEIILNLSARQEAIGRVGGE